MGKKFFTSDWHAGEPQVPHAHSFLRPRPTEIMIKEWVRECHKHISPDDILCFVGDLAINLADLEIYKSLPHCRKILVLGDKEYANKNFSRDEFLTTMRGMGIFHEIYQSTVVSIEGRDYFVSHKPSDCFESVLPVICGHVHGIWRTAQMPNKLPIINVGIDAWGGLVTEAFITHQYNAVTKHYDKEAFPNQW